MKYFMPVLFPLLLLATFGTAAGDANDQATKVWSDFEMGYYKHPEPTRVSEIITAMAKAARPVRQSSTIPAVMFFSYVFAANPSMKAGWEKQIASLTGQTQALMSIAIDSSPERLLERIPPSAGRNDAWWACFFATGKSTCLDELIEDLPYMRERFSETRFYIGFTAKWSLASNMVSHPLVRSALMNAAEKNPSPEVRAQAASVLKMSAWEIRQLGAEIVRNQEAAGVW